MKKILFIISSLQNLGGTERVATTIANELAQRYDITILSKNLDNKPNAYTLSPVVKDIKFKVNDFFFLTSVKSYIKTNSPDIVVIHTMSKLTPMLILSGVKNDSIWSLEHISYEFHNKSFRFLRRILYKNLDKVLVFTETQKIIFNDFCNEVNIIKNPSPISIKDSSYDSESKKIVSIGRLTYQKGYERLLKSWALLEKDNPKWSLHIYGEGEDKQKLLSLIKQLNLSNVYLEGQVSEIINIYDTASFYVMSSRFEGLPMVLIEAQSRGLPIISFDCPTGPREIIEDNINGYLVSDGDINSLANAMIDLIHNPNKRLSMSDQAKISAERFVISNVIDDWDNLLAQ